MNNSQEIPALTKSGGLLSQFGGKEAVLEYRVWIHYRSGGDDEYIVESDLARLQKARKRLLKDDQIALVEQPLAVVWDDKHEDYREVCIDGVDYSDS